MSAPWSDPPSHAPLDATRRALFDVAGLYEVASHLLGVRDAAVIASRVVHSAIGTLAVEAGALYLQDATGKLQCAYATTDDWPSSVSGWSAAQGAAVLRAGVAARGDDAWPAVDAWPHAAVVGAIAYGDALLGVLVLGASLVPDASVDRHLAAAFAGLAARALHAAADSGPRDAAALRRLHPALRAFDGESAAVRDLCEQLLAVAPSPCAVVLSGEPGSGRSLAARVLHALSPRAGGPFTEIDCALLDPVLLERALFGDAARDGAEETPGLCRLHAGGTVALAHVEALAPSTQDAIAAVLRTGQVHRVGEASTERVDVRFIALAAGDLRGDSGRPRLREDLAYRLSAFGVRVPTLAERREDVPSLVARFLATAADAGGRPSWHVAPDALLLLRHAALAGHLGHLQRVVAAVARGAAHDVRITAAHVERALRECEGAS